MDNEYITLEVEGLTIQVKFEGEGVILDVFKGDEVITSTWRFYDELPVEPSSPPKGGEDD
jgi:hypothetical protein